MYKVASRSSVKRLMILSPYTNCFRHSWGSEKQATLIAMPEVSSIRTVTVGSGIEPESADPRVHIKNQKAQRSRARSPIFLWGGYRRWGIAPRPENTPHYIFLWTVNRMWHFSESLPKLTHNRAITRYGGV